MKFSALVGLLIQPQAAGALVLLLLWIVGVLQPAPGAKPRREPVWKVTAFFTGLASLVVSAILVQDEDSL